jgi:hypothetical protein
MLIYKAKCIDAGGCENIVAGNNYYLENGNKYVKAYKDIKQGHIGQYEKDRFEVIKAIVVKEDPLLPKDFDVLESVEEYEQIALF